METQKILRCFKLIIACILLLFIIFSGFSVIDIQAQEDVYIEVSSFDEFISSMSQIQNTGGTIALSGDITVPASESFTYNNGRYRKEVVIETRGYTFYVEGSLSFWPFLTVCGDGSQKELFHVFTGGELSLVSICIDAGEDGIAIIQEEGSFLTYGDGEGMDLPAFSCTGEIYASKTMTAGAYWGYNPEKLPIVRVPEGTEFTPDMLPNKVLSLVNRDHLEYEEEVPVIWDDTTFPVDSERTLVQGRFADGYSQYKDYIPQCLVIWESDTAPFFLNVYLKIPTQSYDVVFMYGETPQTGTIYIQSSDDGENWAEIEGTEGYEPVSAEQNSSFSWILFYQQLDPVQERPVYYRLLQVLDDGTKQYSDALVLNNGLIFTAADIEGGRGGETSPNEGEIQIPSEIPETEKTEENPSSNELDPSTEVYAQTSDTEHTELYNNVSDMEENSNINNSQPSESAELQNDISTVVQPEEAEEKDQNPVPEEKNESVSLGSGQTESRGDMHRLIGTVLIICILSFSVAAAVFKKRK